jgi:transcriptional regulator with XRE-family HTH domain
MMRRVVELHEYHDIGGADEERDPRAVGRANRWDFDRFEWPEFPDVVRELRRLASLRNPPFNHQDLDVLEKRAGQGKSQIETAALLGLTRSAVIRIETAAAERVGPVAERLRESSTDRYLMSVLDDDELLAIYGRESPIPGHRERLEERERHLRALEDFQDRQAARHHYGRVEDTDGDSEGIIGM